LINQKEVAKCSERCQDKLRKVFDKFDQESEAMNVCFLILNIFI